MKRNLSLLLCIALLCTMLPVQVFAGLVKGSATYSEGSVLTGGTGCHYYSQDSASLGPTGGGLMQIYYFGDDGKKHIVYSYEVEGNKHAYLLNQKGEKYRVYCFEHGLGLSDNRPTYYSKTASSHPAFSAMKKSEQQNLKYTVLYGFESDAPDKTLSSIGFFDSVFAKRSRGSYNRDDWYMATQILIWEITQEYRKSTSGSDNLNYAGASRHPVLKYGNGKNIDIHHCFDIIKGKPAEDIYRFMLSMIKNRDSKPVKKSFDKEESAVASPVVLSQADDGTWQADISGNADIVRMFEKAKRDEYGRVVIKNPEKIAGKLTMERTAGGKYHVTWTPPESDPDMKPSQATSGGKVCYEILNSIDGVSSVEGMVLWFRDTKAGNIHDQSLISGSSYQVRKTYYMTITDGKKSEQADEADRTEPAVPSFVFDVTKEDLYGGFDDDRSTARGDGSLAAEFTLYRDGEAVDTVTLDENGSTASLEDTPFEDGSMFLDSSCEYGSRTHTEADSGHSCTVSPTDAKWEFSVEYEIRETGRPEGMYAEPDGTGVRKFIVTYQAHAENGQVCSSEPVSWGDTQITVSVDTPSGKAQLSGKNDSFDDSSGDFFSFESGEFRYTADGKGEVFRNDIHTGTVEIIKENENTSVFKDKTTSGTVISSESRWAVYLKSGGSENHAAVRYEYEGIAYDRTPVYRVCTDGGGVSSDEQPMKIGKNGQMLLKGLPYGEYSIEEVQADSDNYVREKFTCVISECSTYEKYGYSTEGKYDDVYVYGLYDKLKENKIKIEKVNSETGKKVPMKGTRVRIRYMGDPSLSDPSQAKGYGKLLPAGSSMNSKEGSDEFVLDDNGEVTVRYELPYGLYQVEEFSVPEGYFIGTYDADGNPQDKKYEGVKSGDDTVYIGKAGTKYEDLVPVYSVSSGALEGFIKAEEVLNIYTFEVTEEPVHEDGNFGLVIDFDGNRYDADSTYNEADYPYNAVYHAVKISNSEVKGFIEVVKTGEVLTGFEEAVDESTGIRFMKPVFEFVSRLKDAVFEIFAGEDILLNDGSEGPAFYSSTGEKIDIPVSSSTHNESVDEALKDVLENEYSEDVYSTGSIDLESGGRLWTLLERKVSEENRKITTYLTPYARPSEYSYTYEIEKGDKSIRYDISCRMSYTPGGSNLTAVKIYKTTVLSSAVPEIKTNLPEITVDGETPYTMGGDSGNPVSSYTSGREIGQGTAASKGNEFDYGYSSYIYHADGTEEENWDGQLTDFAGLSDKRYTPSYFEPYILTEEDMADETRGDVTKTAFEWEHDAVLSEGKAAGDRAVAMAAGGFRLLTVSCTSGGSTVSYEDNPQWTDCDKDGNPVSACDVYVKNMEKDGWTALSSEKPLYVIMTKGEEYAVLCTDDLGRFCWNSCDENGDFQNAVVEVFEMTYTQRGENSFGFDLCLDGFRVSSAADCDKNSAVTQIESQSGEIKPDIIIGEGYVHSKEDGKDIFVSEDKEEPVYLLGDDGVKTTVKAMGEWVKAVVTVPVSAVSADFDIVSPQIRAARIDGEGRSEEYILDWYSKLSSDNRKYTAFESDNLVVRSQQHRGSISNDVYYTIEILTKNGSEAPVSVIYGDGYTSSIYRVEKDGCYAGAMNVSGLYRTQRYALSDAVQQLVTDDEGKAVSAPLPLGQYVVREVSAPAGYIADSSTCDTETEYLDMQTPLVKEKVTFADRLCEVQIDLLKAFENAGHITAGSGAVFGIFTAADTEYIGKDSLVGVIAPDKNGKAEERYKLPGGLYYIREISTRPGFECPDDRYYFTAGEETTEDSSYTFDVSSDGLHGRVYMKEKNIAAVEIKVAARYPMPDFEGMSLTEDYSGDGIKIKCEKDASVISFEVSGEKTVTLPGGHELYINAGDYGFEGSFDKEQFSYTPEVSRYFCCAQVTVSGEKETETEISIDFGEGRTAEFVLSENDGKYAAVCGSNTVTEGESDEFELSGTDMKLSLDEEGKLSVTAFYEGDEYIQPECKVDGKSYDVRFYADAVLKRQCSSTECIPVVINCDEKCSAGYIVNKGKETPVPSVSSPYIRTSAYYSEPGNHLAPAAGSVAVTDRITYGGLSGGKIYTAKGELIDCDTGEVISSAEKQFTADVSGYGYIDVEFDFDGTDMAGRTAVVFEKVYLDGVLAASHEDRNDSDQRIYFPSVMTEAADAVTGEKVSYASENMKLKDTVKYTNLVPGEEYRLEGSLVDKRTGRPVEGGIASVTFTAEESSGTVEVIFCADGRNLAGRSVVVFERLYRGDILIGSHEETASDAQTVRIPAIYTQAGYSDGVITDTVRYTNLIPGRTYCMWGTLMDKETGEAFLLNGEKVKGYCFFVPDKESGTVKIRFSCSSDDAGDRELVVFENLYIDNMYRVASHEDITDEKQTVYIPDDEVTAYGTHVKTGLDWSVFRWPAVFALAMILLIVLAVTGMRKKG